MTSCAISPRASAGKGSSLPTNVLCAGEFRSIETRAPIQQPLDIEFTDTDPYEYVLSVNVHRRHLHLTAEQKRKLITQAAEGETRDIRPCSR
jgi:hypothetical protein